MDVAICSIVKDTPNYLMKAWIDHHFKIGITDIYLMIDMNSKPIYQDSRVHYEYLTDDTRLTCINLGKRYAIDIATNDGMYFQVGVYNYMVQKYREKYDWIALIDDDEFLHLDLSILNKYSDRLSVFIPWRMKITYNIENTDINVAFVSTNSITQGEQVEILWKDLIDNHNIKINFAHRTCCQ